MPKLELSTEMLFDRFSQTKNPDDKHLADQDILFCKTYQYGFSFQAWTRTVGGVEDLPP